MPAHRFATASPRLHPQVLSRTHTAVGKVIFKLIFDNSIMGSVAGKGVAQDSELTPDYETVGHGSGYEVRAYKPYIVAEVQTVASRDSEDDRFRTLAKYIGVFGNPSNKAKEGDEGEKISMTAPVVIGGPAPSAQGEKISMTAPVVQTTNGGDSGGSEADAGVKLETKTMQFIMPKKFKSVSELPEPTDDRVSLKQVPEQLFLVRQFSGNMGSGDGHDATAEYQRVATEKAVKEDGGAFADFVDEKAKFSIARYNPPWTLPFLKTNELWFPLSMSREEAAEKLPKA